MIDSHERKGETVRCALYARVSTREQASEGESLDEQIAKMKAYCKYQGWEDFEIYREEGFSGKNTSRPAFQRMMSDVERGNIQKVIMKKIDRLSRSIVDFENTYKTFERKGVDLISLHENFDTSKASGRGALRMVLVFAQMERELISERTKDVLQYRASQGLFNGGYPRLGFDLKDNRLIVISKEAAIVKEIFKVYLQRGSQSKTAIYLNDNGYRMKVWTTQKGVARGGNKFSKSNLSRILRDPAYIGKVKHKGQTFDAGHEAIVDVDTFNAVQSMIDSNIVTKTGFRESGNKCLLRGLVFCGACKSAMVPSFSISKGKEYQYYRCTSDNDKSKKNCYIGA
jgi:site-specific DNA recombinase